MRQLKDAVNASKEARPATPAGSGAKAVGAAAAAAAGIGGRVGTKPYVADLTNFVGARHAAQRRGRVLVAMVLFFTLPRSPLTLQRATQQMVSLQLHDDIATFA